MNTTSIAALAALCALTLAPARQSEADMKKMMEQAARFTQPGEAHKPLERFLGEWTTETRMFMGDQGGPAEAGTAKFRWRLDGRVVEADWAGSMMNMPVKGATWLGYDNFKMSYVMTAIHSFDTAMAHAEGDMTRDGKSLLLYGTIDEYLTGEHDKMVKYIWRFPSADKMVFEVHDLPIGETGTKVVEVQYTRVK